MPAIPDRLKDDAIVESLAEARFESNEVPEVIIGRLTDAKPWRDYQRRRLAISDVPTPIRQSDESLKYQPAIELRNEKGPELIKVGTNSLSFHLVGARKYIGWKKFFPILRKTFGVLFHSIQSVSVHRLGLRYTNALTSDRHSVENLLALNFTLEIAKSEVSEPLNINYQTQHDESHISMTRVASPSFVQGELPPRTIAVVDVDVFTNPGYSTSSLDEVIAWIDKAHDYEKEAFFRLLPDELIKELAEDT